MQEIGRKFGGATAVQTQERVNAFIQAVYGWMAAGLALTGLVAFATASSPSLFRLIVGNQIIFFGLIIAELALVFILSSRVAKMSAGAATGMFIGYSALNGLTLSVIFLAFSSASIASTFFICAGTFAAVSVYGMTTKKDLTGVGNFMFMGLIGIIIASVVNMFVQSGAVATVISYIGVLVFVGLTAYDTQKLKHMALTQPDDLDGGTVRKGAILGALSLYLDFINLFLFLLHIFGGGRD